MSKMNSTHGTFPLEVLNQYIKDRKKNAHPLSMRALARKLGCSQSLLSQVFNGKKKVTSSLIFSMAKNLNLPAETKNKLLGLQFVDPPKDFLSAQFQEQSLHTLKWVDLAILDLTTADQFVSDIQWIADYLGVPPKTVQSSLEKLQEFKLLKITPTRIVRSKNKIYFNSGENGEYARAYHHETIHHALEELKKTDSVSEKQRFFQGMSFVLDPKLLPAAKLKLKSFMEEMCDLTDQSKKNTELYQLNLHLFPLRKSSKRLP